MVAGAALRGMRSDLGQVGAATLIGRAVRRFSALWSDADLGGLLHLPIYQAHLAAVGQADPLFFLSHRQYLARDFTNAERTAAATCHYLYEDQTLTESCLADVYHGGGLVLWSAQLGPHHYDIRLTGGLDVAHEGALSLTLRADSTKVCVISFSILPQSLVATDSMATGRAVLITRKQLTRDRDYQKPFFAAFERSAPAHLVLAALEGIVQARGGEQIYGLRATSHPIHNALLAPHLTAAYCDFWCSLGGQISSHRAYVMGIPMQLRPLEDLKSDRRERAITRRSHAEDIRSAARNVMAASLVADAAPLSAVR